MTVDGVSITRTVVMLKSTGYYDRGWKHYRKSVLLELGEQVGFQADLDEATALALDNITVYNTLCVDGCFPDEHRCGDGKCLRSYHVCDGINDCNDFSDEANCGTQTIPDINSNETLNNSKKRKRSVELKLVETSEAKRIALQQTILREIKDISDLTQTGVEIEEAGFNMVKTNEQKQKDSSKNKKDKNGKRKTTSKSLDKKRKFLRLAGLTEATMEDGTKLMTFLKEFLPNQYETKRTRFRARYKRSVEENKKNYHQQKRSVLNQEECDRKTQLMMQKESVTSSNCKDKNPAELVLPGDVGYNVAVQFSPQARTGLRLAHFLSNFLQNIDVQVYYGLMRGDNLLNVEQLYGEVLANVMGDLRIKGSGVFFDIDKYEGPNGDKRQFFGPFAYRHEAGNEDSDAQTEDRVNTHFRAIDYAGFPDNYLDQHWFRNIKERWQANTFGLEKFTEKPMIRADKDGYLLRRFEDFPMYYYAPRESDGVWSDPYFDCNGYVDEWVLTYSVPFFGKNTMGSALEFKGVVTITVKLDDLDTKQCSTEGPTSTMSAATPTTASHTVSATAAETETTQGRITTTPSTLTEQTTNTNIPELTYPELTTTYSEDKPSSSATEEPSLELSPGYSEQTTLTNDYVTVETELPDSEIPMRNTYLVESATTDGIGEKGSIGDGGKGGCVTTQKMSPLAIFGMLAVSWFVAIVQL